MRFLVIRSALLAAASSAALLAAPATAQTSAAVPADNGSSTTPQQTSTQAPTQDEATTTTAPATDAQPGQSSAPPATQGALPDIVVTAQRRSENLQRVPIAVTALSPAQLNLAGVADTSDLKDLTPGLNFNTNLGGFGQPRIRGVGTTATGPGIENPVATYIDGVYIATSAGALLTLNDISQVAVLKGPQGTLFGRNATGGLIQVTTREPSQTPHAEVSFGYGNYNTVTANAYVTGGLANNLAASVAMLYDNQQDGFGKNLYNGLDVNTQRNVAGRAKLLWTPGASTKVTVSADYSDMTGAQPAIRTFGLRYPYGAQTAGTTTPGGKYDIDLDVQPYLRSRQWGTSLTAQQDFGGVRLTSITAYRDSYFHVIFDADQLPIPGLALNETQLDRQVSQELQLESTGNGPFTWVAGAFYFHSVGKYDPLSTTGIFLATPQFPLQQVDDYVDQKLNSYAGYAQGTYAIDPATHFTAGIRYTSDHRDITESETLTVTGFPVPQTPLSADKTFNKLTWRLALDHRFSPDVMGYISYNRGFKSGSYAPDTFPVQELKPETLDAYEAGLKTELFDHRVRFNIAGYYYDQKNLQVNQIVQGVLYVYNASGATSYGVDADLTARVTDNFTLNAGAGWLHARYKSFLNAFELFPLPSGGNSFDQNGDATGNQLQNTPAFTANLGGSYAIPSAIGKFTLAANYYHNSGYYADPQNRLRQAPYDLVDASVTWTSNDDHLMLRVWTKNLTNTFYVQQLNPLNVGDNYVASPPRTFGATVGFKF